MNQALDRLPALVCNGRNLDFALLTTNADLGAVRICTSPNGRPIVLDECPEASVLDEVRLENRVFSLTLLIRRINDDCIESAVECMRDAASIREELQKLTDGEHFVCYVVTHFNSWPAAELTVFIGGDCYRSGANIVSLASAFQRTRDLAHAMVRKSVMVFPDIPVLHGGKKGEWIVVDKQGLKVEGLSDRAIVALGTLVIPEGIGFINALKEQWAKERGIYADFPAINVMRPDTASPDVMSGPNWAEMCQVWSDRGRPLDQVTCLPASLGGPKVPSSHPTAYGVVTTALKMRAARFPEKSIADTRFLLEALGGVGTIAIARLLELGANPANITGFDRSEERCAVNAAKGVRTVCSMSGDFYRNLNPATDTYDVWINNGEGDNTTPDEVRRLLDCGVRVFCGGANNFLQEKTKSVSLNAIFEGGGWAWPDEAASGGGWTLAVIDVMTRARGLRADSEEAKQLIVGTIESRNAALVDSVLARAGSNPDGRSIWNAVHEVIDQREAKAIAMHLTPEEIASRADVTTWNLS